MSSDYGIYKPGDDMKITDILNESVIKTNLAGNTKEEIINAMIELAATQKQVVDKERMRAAIFDREKIMSTGVGSGFAIPHGKTDAVRDIVAAFAVTAIPIDYQSLDDQPVRLIFLLVGKENMVGPHIKLLSRISRLMNKEDFRRQLLEAKTSADVLEIFRKEEEAFTEA
jgi:fructose-specific phosphotransferase system IIA component